MPNVGDIVHGRDIGRTPPNHRFRYCACPDCGKERWVCNTTKAVNKKCFVCKNKEINQRLKIKPNYNLGEPQIGEIRKGRNIDSSHAPRHKYVYQACSSCGTTRWVALVKGEPQVFKCPHCGQFDRRSDRAKGTISNPEIGDIRRSDEISKHVRSRCYYIWAVCEQCNKPRWTHYVKGNIPKICKECANLNKSKSMKYKYSIFRYKIKNGYAYVKMSENDLQYSQMFWQGWVLEHRLVMARHLGRCLDKTEFVHHKNGIKDDNRIENLELTSSGKHSVDHSKGYQDGWSKGYSDGQNAQIKELLNKIAELSSCKSKCSKCGYEDAK